MGGTRLRPVRPRKVKDTKAKGINVEWTDEGIVLSVRPHGESAAVVTLMTEAHGRHAGLMRGGASARHKGMLQPGNAVRAVWRARLAEQLGSYSLELGESHAADLFDDPLKLSGLSAACAVADRALPEREPHPAVHAGLEALIQAMRNEALGDLWIAVYVRWELGLLSALPVTLLMVLAFLAPLVVVAIFSIMPPKVFSLANTPDFSAYAVFFKQGYYKSLLWSLGMALASTVILLVVCWPLAYAMAKIFKRFTLVLTIAIVMSLFVSENIRLFGWVLTLMKGGLIEGHFRALTGIGFDSPLYGVPIIVFGLVYVYLPFMLFPLAQGISMVPDDTRQAAYDLGATRWQVLWQIEIPLAAPGIVVGSLLSFVLAAGALAESKILGGQAVIAIADDIETAFTFGQNWPLGSALSMILIVIIGTLALFGVSKVDLDAIMGRKR
mgnify:CR=1 FL=1